jgi:hypothetical protein
MAVEERNWLASANSAELSVSDVLRSPSLKELVELVAAKSLSVAGPNGIANGVREVRALAANVQEPNLALRSR